MKNDQYFRENATEPTAFSIGCGKHICFSIANEIYKRDEAEIKKLTNQYGLKVHRSQTLTTFYK